MNSSKLKKAIAGLAFVVAAAGLAESPAPQPTLELVASSTNLVVTEQCTVSIKLWMPPLTQEGLAETPPLMNQRPPHLLVPFWTPDWKSTALAPLDPRRVPPIETRAQRGASVYTLNDYVTDAFSSLRDPFGGGDPFAGLFDDDDFFGRRLGPRKARFPFAVRRAERNGVKGWEFTVESLPYQAKAPGHVMLGTVNGVVPVITAVRVVRDRFGRASYQPTLKEVKLRTRPLAIDVLEPPETGRPVSYCGAIASNLVVKATLDANVCTAGDPLMLTLDIAGATDLSAVVAPSFAAEFKKDGVFRLDEGSMKTETLADSRRFTWRVRPLKAGTVEFPSLPVSYYDVGKRVYVTKRTESIPVQVKAGVQAALGALDEAAGDEEAFPMPDGIDLDLRGAKSEPLVPHLALVLVLFLVPPLLFTGVRLAPPVRRRVAARREAARRASAYAICAKALKGRDGAKRAKAISRFFADRYGVNGATVTAADARRLMSDDFSEAEIAVVVDALTEADRTNYSAKKTIVSLLVVGLAAWGAFAASPEFTYRRAGSLATHATDAKGFAEAAKAYAECVEEGVANPVVYANLGACALLGGKPREAVAAFACAERRGGATAGTERGLRAALARVKNDPRADLPLARSMCAPHVMFTLDARLLFAAAVWALFWMALLLPPGGWRRMVLTLLVVAFVASAGSSAVSLAGEALAKGVVHAIR